MHQVAEIGEERRKDYRFIASQKMRRGGKSGSARLKEPGAVRTSLKDGTPRPLDFAYAVITSYQVGEGIQSTMLQKFLVSLILPKYLSYSTQLL